MDKKTLVIGVMAGILLSVAVLKFFPTPLVKSGIGLAVNRPSPTITPEIQELVSANEVLPDSVNLNVSFGNAIVLLEVWVI